MDFILITYIAIIIIAVFTNNKKDEDYLSVEHTTNMRGIAAIGIIIHHMSERTTGGYIFGYMAMTGYLFVAFFFFMSGYGLLVQYQKKKGKYLNGFIKNRLMYIVIIYLLDIVLYTVVKTLLGEHYTPLQILKSIIFTGIANNSWYMVVLILLYVSFYIIFKCKIIKTIPQKIACVFGVETAFFIICIFFKINPMWYLSNYGFVMGMIWANHKEKIDEFLKSHYIIALIISLIVAAFLNGTPILTDKLLSDEVAICVRTAFRLFSPLSLVALLLVFVYKFKPSLFIWKWLGGISLEIYLIHGLVYTVLRSNVLWVKSEVIWVVLTIAISIALAYPMNLFNKQIAKLIKQ